MKLAVLYAGQGAQHPGMGKEFTKHLPLSVPRSTLQTFRLICTASASTTRTAF